MLASEGCLRNMISICNQCCGVSRLRTRQGGNGNRRMSAVAPLTPSQSPPMLLGFYRYKGDKKENNGSSRNLGGRAAWGARLRTRKVRGRDASLPAPLLTASLGLVGRGTVGALPQTPQGTLSRDPARGNCPLTPFAIELVALSGSFRVQLFGASPKPLFAPPTFREEYHTSGDAVAAESSATYTAAPSMLTFSSSSVRNKYSA